ncbi:MAG: helix-turn-helix domain-containing protein [Bacteroidota bacterium]
MLPLAIPSTLLDIILLVGLSQGFFLALTLILIQQRNRAANRVLSMALLIAALMLLGRLVIFRSQGAWVFRAGGLADTTIFLFGPLIYTYVRRLSIREEPVYTMSWGHYFPAIAHLFYFFYMLSYPFEEVVSMSRNGALTLAYFIVELAGILSLAYYLFRSWRILHRFRRGQLDEFSFDQQLVRFLFLLLTALSVLWVLWSGSFISIYGFKRYFLFFHYNVMWTITPVFIYVIGYFSLSQPEIFRIPLSGESPKKEDQTADRPHLEESIKKEKDRLSLERIQQLNKRLHYYMEEEKVYRHSDLTMRKLAEKLNCSPNDLSWLLNQFHQTTFYDFINLRRIKAFLAKIEAGQYEQFTLLSLAYEVGFNSKSTFNRVFKLHTGETPSQYVKRRKVA